MARMPHFSRVLCARSGDFDSVYRPLTTISSHPLRYFTLALLHLGGFTLASHPTNVISEAQLTGITRLGKVAPPLLRKHPAIAIAEKSRKTTPQLFTRLPPIKMP